MFVIVLNSNNIVDDGQNNKLVYKFPNSITFKNKSISVSSISMYYCWANISSVYNNNTFSYTWTVGNVTTTYQVVIPNGIYEISDLNSYLQFVMIKNGTYLINGTSNVYYAEFVLNPSRYAVEINTYSVSASLPSGYTEPPGFAGFPSLSFNPVITLPANINKIFGYVAGFATDANVDNSYVPPTSNYVSKTSSGTLTYLSTLAPTVQPNSSLYVSMSNINNPYSSPSSIIYSVVAQGAAGTLITERPPNFMWNKMIDGTYSELRLTFLGYDYSPIPLSDKQMTIMLTIKDNEEITGK